MCVQIFREMKVAVSDLQRFRLSFTRCEGNIAADVCAHEPLSLVLPVKNFVVIPVFVVSLFDQNVCCQWNKMPRVIVKKQKDTPKKVLLHFYSDTRIYGREWIKSS